ncbi:DUF2079 domain-containing protein [Actinospica durhamensis]|uniref:DUF2079 domain-containing protein n=1 Tax=Actinospica durhamensis TaxID=1508375 RepID=A0A941EKB0_9ACTN|nr:DUF2079 domain-containing protein [Actinospica durhamensis]MBR7832405.1 DUF2079 domain-containing protein [Actinospica durhamensis]
MAPGSYDLGIFVEAVKQYAHFHAPIVDIMGQNFNLLGDHFHPILAVLGPVFLLFPSPLTLLIAQALLFAVAAVPLVWLARTRLGEGAAYAVGVTYGLSFGVAQAVDFDFHEIAFAVPLLAFALWALLEDRPVALVVSCFLALLCKEDIGLTFVLPIGLAVMLRGRLVLGAAVAAMGTAGSLIAIYWLIPMFNPQHVYTYWSKNGCLGTHGAATTGAVTTATGSNDPITCLLSSAQSNAGTKLDLVFLLLAVTAFCAARSPLGLLVVPNLALRFISTDSSFWGTGYHYNAVLMPVLCVAAIDGIDRARRAKAAVALESEAESRLAEESEPEVVATGAGELAQEAAEQPPTAPLDPVEQSDPIAIRRWAGAVSGAMGRHGAVAMLAACAAMIPQFAFNQFFDPGTFTFDARTDALRQAESVVPSGVTVEATINVLAPLAARDDAYWIGNSNPATQYVVLDTVVSGFPGTISDPVQWVESRHTGHTYQIVYSDAFGIYVLKLTS